LFDVTAAPPVTPPSSPAQVLSTGLEAALVAAALGFMYALLVSAPLGAVPLAMAMASMLIGHMVGGVTHAGGSALFQRANRAPSMVLAVVAVVATGLLAGLLQLLFGALRLGSAMKFLPFPVVAGFTNTIAASMIVGMLPAALGVLGLGTLWQVGGGWQAVQPGAVLCVLLGTGAGLACARQWWCTAAMADRWVHAACDRQARCNC